ncbi:hypothetical protein PG991_010637 [Apiospora marii]|uniref:Uncharacterized protein n=1 Tax=Apiospora marii TaxID=335849 RepID=A0ABR1RDZ6_9PEZI
MLLQPTKRSEEPINCDYSGLETISIDPDPDIGGIGIVVSFIITAWLIVFLLIFYYWNCHDPRAKQDNGQNPNETRANIFDDCLYQAKEAVSHRLFPSNHPIKPAIKAGVLQTITAFGDMQLFTGLSMLISGFARAPDKMSGYHWKIITRLAWFSTITHLAALSSWHHQPHRNTRKQIVRLILMSCVAIMLVVALMVTADDIFRNDYYAYCFMQVPRPNFDYVDVDPIFSCILLSSNIGVRIFKLNPEAQRLLYLERLSHSYISLLGPMKPREDEDYNANLVPILDVRPQGFEPFLGYYDSLFWFKDLVWQLCIWTLFVTLIAITQGAPGLDFFSFASFSCAIWTFVSVGRDELGDWKRLSEDVELAQAGQAGEA